MHPDFHNLLADVADHSTLTFRGDTSGDGRWTNGKLLAGDDPRCEVMEGVPWFAGVTADPWGDDQKVADHLARLGRTAVDVVRSGFEQTMAGMGQRGQLKEELDEVLSSGGPIVEVNCGHGGGFAPLLITADPDLPLIMVDPGRWLLKEWVALAREKGWTKLSCLQALADRLPFRDSSLGAITSYGGYSNSTSASPALKEALRVLRPGGVLLMLDARPDPSSLRRFPADIRDELKQKYPAYGVTYPKLIQGAGFTSGSYIETGRRPLSGRESTLAKLARKHKVRVEILVCKVLMRKAVTDG